MDESTIDAARNGDEAAWRVLYEDAAPRVRAYFRSRKAPDPDDLVGTVFLDAARNIGKFQGDVNGFRGWLFTIAHRRWVDEVRRASRQPGAPLAEAPEPVATEQVEHEVLGSVAGEEMLHHVEALPPAQRSIVLLRVLGELSHAEIADVLGKSTVAVKVGYHRAISALRETLAEAYDEDDDGILVSEGR
jgi:RNA polymerase sigma-70 factor (ECF subfamily)